MWDSIVGAIKGILALPSDASQGVAMVGTIWATLTNYRLWRSLGWLFLGLALMLLGFVVWNRKGIATGVQALQGSK